jgi:hypothetical protein
MTLLNDWGTSPIMGSTRPEVNRAFSANDFGDPTTSWGVAPGYDERCACGATNMNEPAKSIPIGGTDPGYCFARSKIESILERDAR